MKLSEALKKGSDGKFQIRGNYLDGPEHCCALGAVHHGVFKTHYNFSRHQLHKKFPQLSRMNVEHPLKMGSIHWSLDNIIVDLNDNHGWSFEQIIEWLEKNDF